MFWIGFAIGFLAAALIGLGAVGYLLATAK